jgi:hypothetical protein
MEEAAASFVGKSSRSVLDAAELDVLFPWHFTLDSELTVQSVGSHLASRLKVTAIGKSMRGLMDMQRPLEGEYSFEDFKGRGAAPAWM